MLFRPYPVLTLVTVPALALLIGLGVWQLDRARWKEGLIAAFERASTAQPAPLGSLLCDSPDPLHAVAAAPEGAGPELRVFGHNAAGDVGWRIFRAAALSCNKTVLVESAFAPLDSPASVQRLPPDRLLIDSWPARQWLAAPNFPDRNEWHWFDAPAMASALGIGNLDSRYVATALAGMPDYLTRTPPSGHIAYAVTWFGLAVALAVIYGLFHARAGRLRWRSGGERPQ